MKKQQMNKLISGGVHMNKKQQKTAQQPNKTAEKKTGYGDKKLEGTNRPAE
ncbi:hypothetical protein JCM21738_165 [Mesobacillus boroniphilus JCM 21738]|uniref:Uncharacterized protein n=1 Tax=Mesobacillus boroniphilus JCM 21738 TaxID=1294265 RepID=W4RHA4_9BACI|nr:hypothetical protein JCM21738_165 [Mesobacillus boroniphilus JCM 21738]